jgi:hypothetical protein
MPQPFGSLAHSAGASRTAVEPPRIHDAQLGPIAQLGEIRSASRPAHNPGSGGTGLRDGHHRRRGPLVGADRTR